MSFREELIKMLGYHLYSFRKDNHLTTKEMLELLQRLADTPQFRKEYGLERRGK